MEIRELEKEGSKVNEEQRARCNQNYLKVEKKSHWLVRGKCLEVRVVRFQIRVKGSMEKHKKDREQQS